MQLYCVYTDVRCKHNIDRDNENKVQIIEQYSMTT